MEDTEITAAAKKAEQIAKDFDEPYKSIVFKTMLDRLLSGQNTQTLPPVQHTKSSIPTQSGNENRVEVICSSINRTDHPDISKFHSAKDRAIFILRIARDKAGIDGLSAPEISQILDKVFRLHVTRHAITMSLGPEAKLVDRKSLKTKGIESFIYRVMAPGEEHLDNIIKGEDK